MPAKIIISEFQTGLEVKSINITIQNEDESHAKYGVWSNGASVSRREKSSCLVVKILNGGNEASQLDLDLCARQFSEIENETNSPENHGTVSVKNINTLRDLGTQLNVTSTEKEDKEGKSNVSQNLTMQFEANLNLKLSAETRKQNIKSICELFSKENVMSFDEDASTLPEPLEYGLKKVNENNQQILRNIWALNRVLEYTKKNEMVGTVDPKTVGSFSCSGCKKTFLCEAVLKRHVAREGCGEVTPALHTVWLCGACHQVWPWRDLLVKHTETCLQTETKLSREIKTSVLLQCEFCEKAFTSIARLLRHSAKHTTDRNYECGPCDAGFASYRAVEQHWQRCSWQHKCYSFILPKMLMCNVCNGKFPSYDQLYNHRYKADHFSTKIHYKKTAGRALAMMVHQCELCEEWLPFPSQLLLHRRHSHPHHCIPFHVDGTSELNKSPDQ